jgi:hypothetical protein
MTDDREYQLPDLHDPAAEALADARLEEVLHGIAPHYRVPPPPPLDAMWAQVEAAHFGRPGLRLIPGSAARRLLWRWGGPVAGLAAGLLIGVGFGMDLGRRSAAPTASADVVAERVLDTARDGLAQLDPAYREVATDYFDQTAALLVTLPAQLDEGGADAHVVRQASELLSTTRLLLDSPAGADPELQTLLDDLELILAQIVRLPAVREPGQAALIADALEARHVLPRLRNAAALSSPVIPLTRGGD